MVSVFGRLSYNFKERYLFTGTLRADGSSKFAKGNQWGIFPSASAAWRISEEAFLEDVDFLDNLKLRVGYGTAGNNNVDNNMYATSYGSGHYGINGSDYITYVPGSTLGNSNLKWEKTTTTNVGLDISVLGSRVNLSVDFYNNESSNLLIKNKIPTSTGYSDQYQNIGAIRNRGVELVLNTTNIRTKDFTWNTDFNIAFNRSKVLELYGNKETNYFIQDYESRMGYKIEVGKPLGQFYGLVYDGIYTTDDFVQQPDGTYMLKDGVPSLKGFDRSQVKPGDAKYVPQTGEVDENGNPVWSTNDRTVIGSAAPKFTGGMNNTFRYKGFDLSVFMNFSFGNDVFNMSTQRFIGPYLSNQNSLAIMNNRFTLIDPATGKEATRVLVAKMHFENMLLNIKSIDYYAEDPDKSHGNKKRIPLVSFSSNIDFSNGKTFVKDFGMDLPKPMPSGFVNMLIKEKLFKGGTFIGHVKLINTGKYPTLQGDMKVSDVRIPSQRLYIKEGEFKTDNDHMHISSNGRYRRSSYHASGVIMNEIKFPIIVKDAELGVDNIDVEKYLQIFNNQTPSDVASDNVQKTVEESIAKNVSDDDDDNSQTFDLANLIIEKCRLKADKGFYKDIKFSNVVANLTLDENSVLKIDSNKFNIADGTSSAKINCDLKKHKYSLWLALVKVDSDIIASSLLNLPKEINGKASGLMELETDDSLKLNGRIQFRVYEGIIPKIGLVEYTMKVAALFRNPLTMVTPSIVSDLVSVPEGKFEQIDGDLRLKDNVIKPMMIKSSSPQLSSFIVGTYDLEAQDAALRIYTKFSNRKKGIYGFLRNLSLNSLANRIPLSSRTDSDYYSAEISQLPKIDAEEKDCQIFLTKVDGDIVQNNFLSSLKKIK